MSTRKSRFKAAAIQLTSTTEVERNLRAARRLVRRAADAGAELVALPENFAYLRSEGSRIEYRQDLDGELPARLSDLARETGTWLLGGSIPERIPRSRRIHNTSLLFDPAGRQVAVYRKLHLFDVGIRGRAEFRESKTVAAGDLPVIVSTPLARLGLSICYDLRFPELYRKLALAGAEVLLIPSAFTAYTGKFHWMTLLRARAIENQCWVVAPAQAGRHSPTRRSFGHTAVIDPWGEVVALRERGPGIVVAEIDLDRLAEVRRGLPALRHVRRDLIDGPC